MLLDLHGRTCRHVARALALLSVPLYLIGCGTAPQPAPVSEPVATRTPAARDGRSIPALPPAGSGRGGYYMDDGPGDSPPEGLLDTPDAEPRVEPYTTRGNKPYTVFGKTYTPFTDDRPFKQRGIGSWYGRKFHGQKTSSGEPYDMYKMTAAHPVLPIPSYARVTNVANGKQVIVRVNDRGPFHSGRVIDLSYTAALKLGYLGKGSSELEVERLLPEEIARMAKERAAQAISDAGPDAGTSSAVVAMPVSLGGPEAPRELAPLPAAASATAPAGPAFYVQLGAYSRAANAEAARAHLKDTARPAESLELVEQGSLVRLFSGPYISRDDADAAARRFRDAGARPMIVQR